MMKFTKTIIFILLGFVFILASCKDDKSKKDTSNSVKSVKSKRVKIPLFVADSAFANVKKQVDFGTRVTGSEGHKKAQEWFIEKFKSYGAEVEVQKFDANFHYGNKAKAANIIARFNPNHPKKVIIAAHYDTRYMAEKDSDPAMKNKPIDGADDGASGVAVILELARLLNKYPIDLGVDLVLFDAEDNGDEAGGDESWCLGSQYWSKQAAANRYKADFGILLDLVGAKNAVFPKEGLSRKYAEPIQTVIWDLAGKMGYSDLFADVYRGAINDDHLYVNQIARIPMVDIISIPNVQGGFGKHHHTHQDNINIIDKNTLRRTGQVVISLLFKYSSDSL